jgi:hypothetical protein
MGNWKAGKTLTVIDRIFIARRERRRNVWEGINGRSVSAGARTCHAGSSRERARRSEKAQRERIDTGFRRCR